MLLFCLFKYKTKLNQPERNQTLLVYGIILVFYVAHSLFWYLGLFHSFGLKRVFIAIIPLILIVGLEGLESLLLLFSSHKTRTRIIRVTTIIILIFPFTKNKMALGLPQNYHLSPNQAVVDEVALWLQSSKNKHNTVSYANHYFAMSLDIDMDNPKKVLALGLAKENYLPKGTIVLWDSYFAPSDQGVEQSFFVNNQDYKQLKAFSTTNGNYIVMVYQKVR